MSLLEQLKQALTPSPLAQLLRERIRRAGPLSLEEFMRLVLHHPLYGYYSHGTPVGAHRDFVTSPEICRLFSETLAIWCLGLWEKMGSPKRFTLLELGPGKGTMMRDILLATSAFPAFQNAADVVLFESSETLRAFQRERLVKAAPRYVDSLTDLPKQPLLVLANEFFDTLPLRQFVRTKRGWYERKIVYAKGQGFTFEETDVTLPDAPPVFAPFGFIHEESRDSVEVVKTLGSHIAHFGGAALFIDYGYRKPSGRSSLRAVRHQEISDDLFEALGHSDITADVNFPILKKSAEATGVKAGEIITQRAFLNALGIEKREEIAKEHLDEKESEILEHGVSRLTAPEQMGEAFKVLSFWKE